MENYKYQGTKHSEKLLNNNDATSYMAKNYNQLDLKQSIILYLNTFILSDIYNGTKVKDYLDEGKTFLYIEAIRKTSDNLFDIRIYLWLTLKIDLTFTFDTIPFTLHAGDDAKLSIFLSDYTTHEDTTMSIGNIFCRTNDNDNTKQIIKGNNITFQTVGWDIQTVLSFKIGGQQIDHNIKSRASWILPLASNYSECQFPQDNS